MSSCQPHPQGAFLTIFDNIIERPLGPNLLWIFALEMNRYMQRYGLDKRDIAAVAVKNKRNAADHPAALLGQADITIEDVLASEVLAWPVQRLDVSPISDGAVAIVMASEDAARRLTDKPVWVDGVGWNLDTTYWTNRDLSYPEYVENAARMAYEMAGIAEPRKQIHIAEPYDPFDHKERTTSRGCCCSTREGAGGRPRRRDGARRRPAVLPIGWIARRRQPDRGGRADEDRRAVLAASRRGRGPAARHARAWGRAGVGDLMQVGTVVVMRPMGRARLSRGGVVAAVPLRLPSHPTPLRGPPPPPCLRPCRSAIHCRTPSSTRPSARSTTRSTSRSSGTRVRRWGLSSRARGREDRRDALPVVRADVGAAPEVLRAVLPADGSLGGGRGTGLVETFSICHVSWDMQPVDPPELPAVIRLDGASSGGFLHKLGEVEPDEVAIGMAVEAVWRPLEERTGSILDIAYFRPRGDA